MPIYEYECVKCNDVIEAWQSLADQPMTTCPQCAGTLRKLISASSFKLKGGGWYADGYSSSCANAAGGGCGSSNSAAGPAAAASTASAAKDIPKAGGGCSGGSSSCGGCG